MTGILLRLRDVGVDYGPIRALHDVSMDVAAGGTTAVLGANGAGKSTLVKAIAGLVKHHGTIEFDGEPLPRTPTKVRAAGIGHVPEGRRIFARLDVVENLRLGGIGLSRAARNEGVDAALQFFPVLGRRAKQAAGTMSGGEQQMIAIGRALVAKPRLLLLDEPTLGLAPLLVRSIFDSIRTIRDQGTAVLVVEQKVLRAQEIADHALLLHNGKVSGQGAPQVVLTDEAVGAAYLKGAEGTPR